jgi:orotidine-5'-phosphate decarboxylase
MVQKGPDRGIIHFADRLAQAVKAKKTPAIVGIDPRVSELPEELVAGVDLANPLVQAGVVEKFCGEVIDAVADLVSSVKIQLAFFECLGPPGLEALQTVIRYARAKGLLVILDGKRGDIGSTAEAYARAYLGGEGAAPWPGDALTIQPYLGGDAMEPFLTTARERGCGVFVLVRTSNPGARDFQDLSGTDGIPLYEKVAEWVEKKSLESCGECGLGFVGAVVGATYPEDLIRLRRLMPHAWILVPGYGAQGGSAADVAGAFLSSGLGAIVNNSRGIIFAFKNPAYRSVVMQKGWQSAVRRAAEDMIADLRSDTPAARL